MLIFEFKVSEAQDHQKSSGGQHNFDVVLSESIHPNNSYLLYEPSFPGKPNDTLQI